MIREDITKLIHVKHHLFLRQSRTTFKIGQLLAPGWGVLQVWSKHVAFLLWWYSWKDRIRKEYQGMFGMCGRERAQVYAVIFHFPISWSYFPFSIIFPWLIWQQDFRNPGFSAGFHFCSLCMPKIWDCLRWCSDAVIMGNRQERGNVGGKIDKKKKAAGTGTKYVSTCLYI